MRALLLIPVATVALHAQFLSLTTTEDGSVLYFSSAVRQRGTEQTFDPKIFRWDAANGFRVAAEERSRGEYDGCRYPNFYQLGAPSVSADGSTLAYTASRPGGGPTRVCAPTEPSQLVVRTGAREIRMDGIGAVSRNGRYLVSAPIAAVASRYHFVTDLTTGITTAVAGAFDGSWQRVTDEGSVITPERMALVVSDRDGRTLLFRTRYATDHAIIDRAGRTAVYSTRFSPTGPARITRIDLQSGSETDIYSGLGASAPSITSDGSTILFSDAQQLYISAGGTVRRLTNEADRVGLAVISGDGRVVYGVAAGARLVRIDVASGQVTELAPSTQTLGGMYRLNQLTSTLAVGSLVEVLGGSYGSIDFCGREIAVESVFQRGRFQIPWDLPEGPCVAVVRNELFEHGVEVQIKGNDPLFGPILIHDEFRGIVTSTNPARAGEVIVAYMSGLGPVDDSGQLRRSGFRCRIGFTDAPVEYAGLSQQYPGTYQVNIRVPDVGSASSSLTCGWDRETEAVTSVWVGR